MMLSDPLRARSHKGYSMISLDRASIAPPPCTPDNQQELRRLCDLSAPLPNGAAGRTLGSVVEPCFGGGLAPSACDFPKIELRSKHTRPPCPQQWWGNQIHTIL